MTDERDPDFSGPVSQRYRELGAEEPPRELDDTILAAARRAVSAHPAPLVAPTGRRRWYVPLAAAAVIVLSVAVTLRVQLEQPDLGAPAPRAEKPAPAKAAAEVAPKAAPQAAKPKTEARVQAPAAAPAAAESASAALAGASGERDMGQGPARDGARQRLATESMAKRADALVQALAETPERELERIVELRRQGRHDEADKALAEFRKRYPDYKISRPMLERVERR